MTVLMPLSTRMEIDWAGSEQINIFTSSSAHGCSNWSFESDCILRRVDSLARLVSGVT